MSCPFKNILGKPREGIHAMRIPIIDVALVDTVMTIIGAWFIQQLFFHSTPYWKVLLLFFILGEIMHVLFCVKTRISKTLF